MCLLGIHISTCQIFVWVSKGVLSPKGVYVSLLFMEKVRFLDYEYGDTPKVSRRLDPLRSYIISTLRENSTVALTKVQ